MNDFEHLCRDCKDLGRLAASTYRIGELRLCQKHYESRMGQPVKEKNAGDKMPTKTKVDWEAVQRDRDAGEPVSEIAKKYGVSAPRIYARTRASADGRSRPKPKKERPKANGRGFGDVIDDLRKRRDALNEAIEALEKIEA